jgi:hypothetical protein
MMTSAGIISDDDLIENYSHLLIEYALENGHNRTIIKKDNICQKVLRGNRHWFDRVLQKTNENLYRDYGMKLEALPHVPARPFSTSTSSSVSSSLRKSSLIISKSNNLPSSDSYILFNAKGVDARLANPITHPNPSDLTLLFIILSLLRLGNSSTIPGNCLVNNLIKEEDLIDTFNLIELPEIISLNGGILMEKLQEFKRLKYLNSYKKIDELGNQIVFYGAGARAMLEIPLESLIDFTLNMAKNIQYNLTDHMAKVAFGYIDPDALQESSITQTQVDTNNNNDHDNNDNTEEPDSHHYQHPEEHEQEEEQKHAIIKVKRRKEKAKRER